MKLEEKDAPELEDLVRQFWWKFPSARYLAKRVMAGDDEAAYPLAFAVQGMAEELDRLREAKGIE